MKKGYSTLLSIFILVLILVGCSSTYVKDIKAEYFDIGYGSSLYEGLNKVDEETVKLLVNQYNELKIISTTTEEINYEQAITITFVYNDKISGQIVCDDKSICYLSNENEYYRVSDESEIYDIAINVYEGVKEKYN